MSDEPEQQDPFRQKRRDAGVLEGEFQDEFVPMILRHSDVRRAAKDWQSYSSNAAFRVPIPSEEDLRTIRQLPIETDPPQHTAYRKIVEPFFKRPKDPEFIEHIRELIQSQLTEALSLPSLEIVHDFAIPLQSRALAHLLGVPQAEAEIWISWGIHVFKDGAGEVKGAELERYINGQLDRASATRGDDFFSALTAAHYDGRPLTREEMMGFANLTFAGGRDTVIHTVSSIVAYLARHPEALHYLREDPTRVVLAGEEFLRIFSPLTHIGRVCPMPSEVHGVPVDAGARVSLCWASANRDEAVFDSPDEVRLDRKPNPHLAFGSGAHLCLGAAHMRLIMRLLLGDLCQRVEKIRILDANPHIEDEKCYLRQVGYESLVVSLQGA